MKIASLFSGYDSALIALEHLNISYELMFWSEIDPIAITAHNNILPGYKDKNIGDITSSIIPNTKLDILVYTPPCQDLSRAGKKNGATKGSNTRSSLLWEAEKIIKATTPGTLIMEEVPTLLSVFRDTLKDWCNSLAKLGYTSIPVVFNTADFGIPHYRKRLYLISTLDRPPQLELLIQKNNPKPITDFLDPLEHTPNNLWINKDIPNIRIKEGKNERPIILGYSRNYTHPERSNYHQKKLVSTITTKNCYPPTTLLYFDKHKIRRLSHIERARLQGLSDADITKLFNNLSPTSCNKLIGNALSINVIKNILKIIHHEKDN